MAGDNLTTAALGSGGKPCRMQAHGTTIALLLHSDGGGGGPATAPPIDPTGDAYTAAPSGWVAAMIRGPSGSGKSDLALRCLAQPMNSLFPISTGPLGVRLVADDRTDLIIHHGRADTCIIATAPDPIRGLLEMRGLGIVAVPWIPAARLVLVVDLVTSAAVSRYPSADTTQLATGSSVAVLPRCLLAPFEATSALKLLLALVRTAMTGSPVGADAIKHHCLPEGQ